MKDCNCVFEYNDDHHPLLVQECDKCVKMKQQEIDYELPPDTDENPISDPDFYPCQNCDVPDACEDFGCAIKSGIRSHEGDWLC